jgi:hypothetical protein
MPIQSQPTALQAAARGQLRQAVVVAGLFFVRTLARQAFVALQQQRLCFRKLQLERKVGGAQAGTVYAALALQRPVAQLQGHALGASGGNVKTLAGNALVVPEFFALHVGDGGVRKNKLLGRELRLHALRGIHARPEKRELKAKLPPRRGAGVAGDVPPLGAKVGVCTKVARKLQRFGGQGLGRADGGQAGQARRQQEAASGQAGGGGEVGHGLILAHGTPCCITAAEGLSCTHVPCTCSLKEVRHVQAYFVGL